MPLAHVEQRSLLQEMILSLILILVPLTLVGLYVALQGDGQIPEPINSVAFGS
jgi:hypothetical protein